MSFVDVTIRRVPFRNVNPGDTIVLTARYSEYSQHVQASPSDAEQKVDVTVHVPESIPFRFSSNGFTHEQETKEATVTHHWSGNLNVPPVTEKNVANVALTFPRVEFSTFDD
jgi:hypothetical protein